LHAWPASRDAHTFSIPHPVPGTAALHAHR
jgi:hypothetical protein